MAPVHLQASRPALDAAKRYQKLQMLPNCLTICRRFDMLLAPRRRRAALYGKKIQDLGMTAFIARLVVSDLGCLDQLPSRRLVLGQSFSRGFNQSPIVPAEV